MTRRKDDKEQTEQTDEGASGAKGESKEDSETLAERAEGIMKKGLRPGEIGLFTKRPKQDDDKEK